MSKQKKYEEAKLPSIIHALEASASKEQAERELNAPALASASEAARFTALLQQPEGEARRANP